MYVKIKEHLYGLKSFVLLKLVILLLHEKLLITKKYIVLGIKKNKSARITKFCELYFISWIQMQKDRLVSLILVVIIKIKKVHNKLYGNFIFQQRVV